MRARGLTLALVVAACGASAPARAPAPVAPSYAGRPIAPTCSYLGADWLDRPTRADREQPDAVLDALALTPEMTVADVGAGTGYFTVRLARRVAHVVATDLQPYMLHEIERRSAVVGLTNIELRAATDHDAGLAPASVDLVLMVDVYHELADPAAVMASIKRALRPGARVVLVEYRGEGHTATIKPEHKMTLDQMQRELGALGFTLQTSLEFLPDQHIAIFAPT